MAHYRTFACCTALALTMTGQAHAQAQAEVQDDGKLGDIVVTAQRTDQKLQDVPISVSAFSAEAIDRMQIQSVSDISRLAPNMKFDPVSGGSTGVKPYIRGGGVTDGGIVTSESEVSFYVDNVYRARISAALVDFVEMERIEVLRGPQGVLYGRNSSAGAVNFITRTPSDIFKATVQAGYGTWNERRVKGFVTGALSQDGKWRASLNGMVRARDGGRQYNVTLNKKVGKEKFQGGQADLAYVDSGFNARLSGFYTNTDTDGQYSVPNTINPDGSITPSTGSYRKVASPIPSYTHVEQYGATLHMTLDYPGGALTSISGYSHLRDRWRQDFSGGVAASLLGIPGGGTLALFDRVSAAKQHQFSQELQAAGSAVDGKLDYVAGLYYFTETGDQLVSSVIFFGPSSVRFIVDTKSYAGFGQATWHLTDHVSVIAGGRYTVDDKRLNSALNGGTIPTVNNIYKRFTPKVGLNYKVDPDVLLYASYSQGFKSGGYNGLAGTRAQIETPFLPQYTTAYEAGVKADLFDRTVRVNLVGFYNKIRNRQQTLTVSSGPLAGTFIVENYNATQKGLEAEATWKVTKQLSLWMNGSLNDGKYTGCSSATATCSIIGNALPVFPDWNYSIGFDYEMPVGPGKLRLGSDYSARDKYFSTADNVLIGFIPKQDFLNGYVAYEVDKWAFQIAGKNLLQEKGWNSGFGFAVVQPRFAIEPRTVLATARYTF